MIIGVLFVTTSTVLREFSHLIPIHSLMSSHLSFCFSVLFSPFTVPRRLVVL